MNIHTDRLYIQDEYDIIRYRPIGRKLFIAKQEARHKVGLGETPRRLIQKRCRYSSLEKFQDTFDTALDLVQAKPSEAAFLAVFFNCEKCRSKVADDVISVMAVD